MEGPKSSRWPTCVALLSIFIYIGTAQADASNTLRTQPSSFLRGDRLQDAASTQLHARAKSKDDATREDEFFEFVTRPDIGAPKWNIEVYDEDALFPGYWFVAPYAKLDQVSFPLWNGPHIYKGNGELVWSGAPLFDHWNTFDFRIINVAGKDGLSLICPNMEHKAGVMLDDTYTISHSVNMRGELDNTNMHDFTVTDNGTRALTLDIVKGDATLEESLVVGFEGECKVGWEGFRELDVETSEILFDWSAQGHVGLDEPTKLPNSYEELCSHGWDILHLNSIDKFPDGDYLVSSRHCDALFKVSHTDGSIVWRLGGVKSDFRLTGDAKFSRQHHARVYSQNETHTLITLFDNAIGNGEGEVKTHDFSRGLLLSLSTHNPGIAELVGHFDHPKHHITNSRGSLQFLPNGNAFMGWTYGSQLSEHRADGSLLMKAEFKHGLAHTYRAYKYHWIGRPSDPPDVVSLVKSTKNGIQTTVYVSWNGATEVAHWKLFHANYKGVKQALLGSTPWRGFESTITYEDYVPFVVVEAYDADGNVLGTSRVTGSIAEDGTNIPLAKTSGPQPIFLHPIVMFLLGVVAAIMGYLAYQLMRRFEHDRPFKWKLERSNYGPLPLTDDGEELTETETLEEERDRKSHEGMDTDV